MGTSYENLQAASVGEPRIVLIKTIIESILGLVEFEFNGSTVQVNGFRIKNLNDWKFPVPLDFADVIGSPSSICNLSCEFCFEKGNPSKGTLPAQLSRPIPTNQEVSTRIQYYDKNLHTGLFPIPSAMLEPFTNPNLLEQLSLLRSASATEYIRILTNGSLLTEDKIKKLVDLAPICLSISLNSSDPTVRRQIMKDNNPEVAINALPLLNQYKIPYMATLVAWPNISFEDMYNTIKYMDKYNPILIKVYPPGFTRFHKYALEFDTKQYWEKVVSFVNRARSEIQTPILMDPVLLDTDGISPIIMGVIKNSPAYFAGLRQGDIILDVENQPIVSASHAKKLLSIASNSERDVTIKIMRSKKEKSISIQVDRYNYPFLVKREYGPASPHPWGICLTYAIKLSYFNTIYEIIKKENARTVLLLSSPIVSSHVEKIINQTNPFRNKSKIIVVATENVFFGGNVMIGDLLTVDDYIDCINEYKRHYEVDLAIIPKSAFTLWMRDLVGKSAFAIERRTNIKIRFFDNERL